MDVLSERRSLHRRHLHILLQEQIRNLNLSFGIGDAYHGFEFMKQRCKVTDIKTFNLVEDGWKLWSNKFNSYSNNSRMHQYYF